MDGRKKIFEVPETEELHEDSSYLVAMGDGTGTKHIKHKNLIERIKEGLAEWINAKIPVLVNNLLGTEPGQALDARQGPEIDRRLNELSSNLSNIFITLSGTLPSTTDPSADVVLPYPSGYTRFNTFIVSSIWQNGAVWRERFVDSKIVFDTSLQGGGITIRLRETIASGAAFKLVITKRE